MQQELPLKFFSHGPLFRYERPQKGRYRQFHQINFEALGLAEPEADVEIIALAHHILLELGVLSKTVLQLNSLGDKESRESYRAALVKYLEGFKNKLSEDSQARLEKNPLRILDSKEEGDRALLVNAPALSDYYTDATKQFFDRVQKGLAVLNVKFSVNPQIVRGLDYYSHTVFEFVSDHLGAQGTVLAGGRYDGLIEQMGGPQTPAVGFAGGIERLSLLIETVPAQVPGIAIIAMSDTLDQEALKLANDLRHHKKAAEIIYGNKAGKKLNKADKKGFTKAILLGEEEFKRGNVLLRDLKTGEQREVSIKATHEF